MTDAAALAIPTFLLAGHPDRDSAIERGREAARLLDTPPPRFVPPSRPKKKNGRRKRRSPQEIAALRDLGYDEKEIGALTISETERICRMRKTADLWRHQRALRELDKVLG